MEDQDHQHLAVLVESHDEDERSYSMTHAEQATGNIVNQGDGLPQDRVGSRVCAGGPRPAVMSGSKGTGSPEEPS